ncbi:protein-methionine-sulfoxide reductase heme-binding subunit MsrQ [Enterovibrio norvegicus]|uniref:protein-methionine-sulfoxide reductase heme-binding subunit MsrQ n=1 Tax=Enterovibrio norvegicus TaxID=188144 RepID=UPI000C814B7C|nr:protein-methionine-sulfoxide reductase heme-binding subunit MsrQ [Enterovibrio norvegicus]PML78542.1 sulfoxide reductase heme-binding subunit YedZ [Enterovibrio norvegicus]
MRLTQKHIWGIKAGVHLISLGFFINLVWLTFNNGFGADPVEGITHFTGIAALNTLVVALLISPIAKFAKQGMLVRCRRVVGIYSFAWATLHMATFFALDLAFNFAFLWEEIVTRPYMTVGAVGWLILLALTVTSTSAIQRRMGAKWQKLHNTVYLAALLVPIHYYWSVKSGLVEPAIYILLSVGLLAIRWKSIKRIVIRPAVRRT